MKPKRCEMRVGKKRCANLVPEHEWPADKTWPVACRGCLDSAAARYRAAVPPANPSAGAA